MANGITQHGKYLGMASRSSKRSEIWNSGVVVACMWRTFDQLMVKNILGHSVQLFQNGM